MGHGRDATAGERLSSTGFDPGLLGSHRRSFADAPGFKAFSRDALLAMEGELVATAADAWVAEVGGEKILYQLPSSQGLRPGRRLAPNPPPPEWFYVVPKEALPEEGLPPR